MKSDRATEGDILGENGRLWKCVENFSFALTHNAASEGKLLFFLVGGWLYRICMNRRRTLWSRGCKWNWSFSKTLIERPETLSLHCTLQAEKVALSQCLWLEVKGVEKFSVTETIDIIHLLSSLSVRSVSWPGELIKIWIIQFFRFREAVLIQLLSVFTVAPNI